MSVYAEPATLSDLWQLLGMLSVPTAVLLTFRYFNRRGERLERRGVLGPASNPGNR